MTYYSFHLLQSNNTVCMNLIIGSDEALLCAASDRVVTLAIGRTRRSLR